MAYKGYLLKVGEYTVPFRYIVAETMKPSIRVQDIGSYTDGNGDLHRTVVAHDGVTLPWDTGPITEKENRELMDSIRSQFLVAKERKAQVTMWMPEIGEYIAMPCYMPDIEYTIRYADEEDVVYSNVSLKFIGYGGEVIK